MKSVESSMHRIEDLIRRMEDSTLELTQVYLLIELTEFIEFSKTSTRVQSENGELISSFRF